MPSWCFYILYEIENGGRRGRIRGIFVSDLECYQFGESFRQNEVIRNTVVLKKDAIFCYLLWQVIDFSVIALCFWLPTWLDWIVYFGCFEIIPIIYGHPEAIGRKLRKLLDCEDVRRNMWAVKIDEAHLVAEWQVFHICLGACSCTNCNSNWANKIHQLPLELWIQKSLQWIPMAEHFLHMFNTTTHWWLRNQSAASSVHSKTTSYDRERWCQETKLFTHRLPSKAIYFSHII